MTQWADPASIESPVAAAIARALLIQPRNALRLEDVNRLNPGRGPHALAKEIVRRRAEALFELEDCGAIRRGITQVHIIDRDLLAVVALVKRGGE